MTPPSDPTGALDQALAHAERLMASRPDLAGEQAGEGGEDAAGLGAVRLVHGPAGVG